MMSHCVHLFAARTHSELPFERVALLIKITSILGHGTRSPSHHSQTGRSRPSTSAISTQATGSDALVQIGHEHHPEVLSKHGWPVDRPASSSGRADGSPAVWELPQSSNEIVGTPSRVAFVFICSGPYMHHLFFVAHAEVRFVPMIRNCECHGCEIPGHRRCHGPNDIGTMAPLPSANAPYGGTYGDRAWSQ